MKSERLHTTVWGIWFLTLLTWSCSHGATVTTDSDSETSDQVQVEEKANKLLVIMLDGFRHDYYERDKENLKGFAQFLQEGVQVKYVEPIFPSVSFPSWTTLSTGVYPEIHGIVGNFMFDLKDDVEFSIADHNTTASLHWWQEAEPIWTTATRYKKKTFLKHWSRCDVPYEMVKPAKCSHFEWDNSTAVLKSGLNEAVDRLKNRKYELAMVYAMHIDEVGHMYGPDSEETKKAVRDVDDIIKDFLDKLVDEGLDEKVNVLIVSDHGMTDSSEGTGNQYVPLDKYVDRKDVYKVLDRGGAVAIAPYAKRVDKVYNRLKTAEEFVVYRRHEIPDEYHFKAARLVQDILVLAKPKFVIEGLQSSKQIPRDPPDSRWKGLHGYVNSTDMRTIFFARGPDFKKGIVHPPISLVDIYQLYPTLLKVPAQPHNGTWTAVSGMLLNHGSSLITTSNINLVVFLAIQLLIQRSVSAIVM